MAKVGRRGYPSKVTDEEWWFVLPHERQTHPHSSYNFITAPMLSMAESRVERDIFSMAELRWKLAFR